MKDDLKQAIETIRQYLYELEEEKTLDVQNILNVSDFERAVAEVLDGIGITPRTIHLHLTDPLIWSTIRDKTGLSIEHQLTSIFDLTTYELEGMKLEGFEENEYISGMVTSENIFLYNREHAEVDELRQTDRMNVYNLIYETIVKLYKAGHPEVCRKVSSDFFRNDYAEYASICEDLFYRTLKKEPYPVQRIQINITNQGDHNLTSIIERINDMLRKTIPEQKNKRKLRQNVPVYVIATLEKDSQQRWKDSWYWLNEAKLLKEDDPLLRFTDYEDHIGNTLSSRYNSASYYFEDN